MQSGAPDSPPSSGGGPFRTLAQITRGLIFDRHTRRLVMFYTVLAALLMAFAGDVFLADWLREKLQRFAIYWMVCAWLTVLAALLAIYDLLLLRIEARALRRRMRKEILPEDLRE